MFKPYSRSNGLLRLVYPNVTFSKKTDQKEIFLTFDDGPIPEITEFVLDSLKKHKAFATFFCIGDNIRKYPHIHEKVVSAGHGIGNHTYHHLNGWKTKTIDYFKDFKKFEKIQRTKIFRPPYGKIRPHQIRSISKTHEIILWDVLTGDYDQDFSEKKCLTHCFKKTKNGSILVFHDSIKAAKNLQYVLPRFLNYFSAMGYKFKSLV